MRTDHYFDSCGAGQIHYCRWSPEGEPKAILQIVHGIAEFVERYDDFANYLTSQGYLVVAEDHMGHGKSINGNGIQGYFHGGWFSSVADTYHLLEMTKAEYPDVPYILFGHSMGSFMTRTLLCKYPDSGIAAAIICGTGWQPAFAIPALLKVMDRVCAKTGETKPNETIHKMIFGGYNNKVEHKRTEFDWLTRDDAIVDAYIAHPLSGFVASCGLLRDMMQGILYVEQPKNLAHMKKDLPLFFIAGAADPVGPYGKGVRQAAAAYEKAGMERVTTRIYPLCRHEILNEINRAEVYEDITEWIEANVK